MYRPVLLLTNLCLVGEFLSKTGRNCSSSVLDVNSGELDPGIPGDVDPPIEVLEEQ
jgi:hypothetical protein